MNEFSTDTHKAKRVAVLGAGRMGAAAARRLCSCGYSVTVWNRTPERAGALRAYGARVAGSPAQAADAADVVLVLLTDTAAVESALFGRSGAVAAMRSGATVAQMSTIGTDAIKQLAARFPDEIHLLDAPVKGSVPAVESGTLEIFAAGDPAALEAASAILAELGTLTHCGDTGAASALKLVINAAMILAVSSLSETVSLAEALGLPPEPAREALSASPLADALARAEAAGADFPITHARKDLSLASALLSRPLLTAAADRLLRDVADADADLGSAVPSRYAL